MARRVNAHADGPAAMALHPLDRDVEAMLRKSQPGYFKGTMWASNSKNGSKRWKTTSILPTPQRRIKR